MTFCEKVLQEMKKRGIKKSELAHEIDVPYTTLDSMLKRNTENINLSIVYKIARYLNVSVDYLIFDGMEEEQNNQPDNNEELQAILQKIQKLNLTGYKILNAYIDGLTTNKDLIQCQQQSPSKK
jgi:transcriptional regulator with XRE-family HTH domain